MVDQVHCARLMPDPSLSLLFLAAFGAATLLPLQSEGVLVTLMLRGTHPVWTLLAVATFANVLGSLVNAALARSLLRWRGQRWFPAGEAPPSRAQPHYQRFGYWACSRAGCRPRRSLTVIAGVMRDRVAIHAARVHCEGGRYCSRKMVPGGSESGSRDIPRGGPLGYHRAVRDLLLSPRLPARSALFTPESHP